MLVCPSQFQSFYTHLGNLHRIGGTSDDLSDNQPGQIEDILWELRAILRDMVDTDVRNLMIGITAGSREASSGGELGRMVIGNTEQQMDSTDGPGEQASFGEMQAA